MLSCYILKQKKVTTYKQNQISIRDIGVGDNTTNLFNSKYDTILIHSMFEKCRFA